MAVMDGASWARSVFGDAGPTVRELVPQLVGEAHAAMARPQDVSGITGQGQVVGGQEGASSRMSGVTFFA